MRVFSSGFCFLFSYYYYYDILFVFLLDVARRTFGQVERAAAAERAVLPIGWHCIQRRYSQRRGPDTSLGRHRSHSRKFARPRPISAYLGYTNFPYSPTFSFGTLAQTQLSSILYLSSLPLFTAVIHSQRHTETHTLHPSLPSYLLLHEILRSIPSSYSEKISSLEFLIYYKKCRPWCYNLLLLFGVSKNSWCILVQLLSPLCLWQSRGFCFFFISIFNQKADVQEITSRRNVFSERPPITWSTRKF